MRVVLVAALGAALTGCVSDGPEAPEPQVLSLVNPEHDAHCRSLQMQPGTLVYVQCRLAMNETLREAQDAASRQIQAGGAFLPPEVERAVREDSFCNFNESAKASVQPGLPADLAISANGRCFETRNRLEQALRGWQPMQADQLLADYGRDTIATNEATILEARAFR